jgi:tetratricopeptide (TPR) repeat protein
MFILIQIINTMPNKNIFQVCLIFIIIFSFSSCKKFLETKSVSTLSTPSTLDDLQALLDNPELSYSIAMMYGGTDEYYITDQDWPNQSEIDQQVYLWDKNFNDYTDWSLGYKVVYYANNVLLNLKTVASKGSETKKNTIEGTALFLRSHSFYNLTQLFAPQYDPNSASTDLGIVLRLNADINEKSFRSTVEASYDQIIKDLAKAVELLPESSTTIIRPDKATCYALLARVYLQMGKYDKAKEMADACLAIKSTLLDYNTLLPVNNFYPFPTFKNNPEILYYYQTDRPLNAYDLVAKVDSNLYNSYAPDDLRKDILFYDNGDNTHAFTGNYTGEYALFNGLAVDEVYLIRAEANIRLGNLIDGVKDLKTLLDKRWKTGTFIVPSLNVEQALQFVLEERKKELYNRGIRWSDLKRLNKDSKYASKLKRVLNNQTYELIPNDFRYTFLIPREIISITSLPQNPR